MSESSDEAVAERRSKPPQTPSDASSGSGASDGPPGPPPKPAMRKRAPGVRGSEDAPAKTSLQTGDSVGGRFFVERYLGSSAGGVSYLCNDSETQRPVVVKVLNMPYPGEREFRRLRKKIGVASSIEHPSLLSAVGMGRTDDGDIFIAMDYGEGATLSKLVAGRREEGRTLSLRDVFTVLAHTCDALATVHSRGMCHGVLTPYNIYVEDDGAVKVGNLAFGRVVGAYLFEHGKGPFVDSIYVAPEAAEHPSNLEQRSDLYSLGMIAAELLSPRGLPADRKGAHDTAVDALAKYPPALFSLISNCLSGPPRKRPDDVRSFREEFEEIARDAGARLAGPPPEGALPIQPAIQEQEDDGDELFDLFDPDEIEGPTDSSEDRYLVEKEGLDYGPFTKQEVLEQLYEDEIDEHSPVLDRVTQNRQPLGEFEAFRQEVEEYIPKREERRRLQAERRAEIERKVKKGGKGLLVAGIIGGLGVLAWMGWFWLQQPDPEPIPMEQAFASMDDYEFLPPPTEFQTMEVDSDVLEGIFNPEATQEEVRQQIARAQSGSAGGAQEAPAEEQEQQVADVDMTGGAGSDAGHLSDHEINQVITADFESIRDCVLKEARQNPGFRGVTVQFFIRPSGTTGGVELQESQYQDRPVGQCLIERFRAMRFPEHGAVHERGVEYPIPVR